jgi:hypothetical protein
MLIRTLRWISSSPLGRRSRRLDTVWGVIGWWEVRRVPFNLVVGATGIVTSVLILLIAWLSERWLGIPVGLPDPPILVIVAVIAYAVAANACYTGGWIIELIVRKAWPAEGEHVGPISFALGLVFAVTVTLAPLALVALAAIVTAAAQWLGMTGAFPA